jgi:radical SAM-linked protein
MRIRLRYAKLGKVRFLGHRDLARVWERSWRKAQLPIVYTEGFSPRPKMHFGLALSVGFESLGEYLDIDVPDVRDIDVPDEVAVDVEALPARLTPMLPDGVEVQAAAVIERSTTSLQEAVTSCTWHLEVAGPPSDAIADAGERLMAADTVELGRERKGKVTVDDIRPYVRSITTSGPGHRGTRLEVELGTQPRGLRPTELVAALQLIDDSTIPPALAGAVRTHQWISVHGARQEPLALPATWAPHAGARAS